MPKRFVFRARVDDQHQAKIKQLLSVTGYTQSQLLRTLVEQAEVKPPINVPLTRKSDGIRQDSPVASAA